MTLVNLDPRAALVAHNGTAHARARRAYAPTHIPIRRGSFHYADALSRERLRVGCQHTKNHRNADRSEATSYGKTCHTAYFLIE